MPLVSLQLGELARQESSPESSEDGGQLVRTGDPDGQEELASGMRSF